MNNILTFEDYKKMNIRQVESVIYRQFIEEDINDEVNEGIIRKAINKASGKFIQTALADEIEKGKELEKSIKEALDGLNKGFEEIEKKVSDGNKKQIKNSNYAAIERVKEAIKAVQSQAFDTLTLLGSEGEIDFAGFMGSATVSAAANFGILFSPIRSLFITRKAYKYFLGIIKQTIRRNLLVIQLNFDQFENLILQKSFETEEDSEFMTKIDTLSNVITSLTNDLCDGKNQLFKGVKNKALKDRISAFKQAQDTLYKQHKESSRSNPFSSLWSDQYNNTYTKTLEQIKQYINDDSQKELDALKNSVTKMAGSDQELAAYGELLIAAAEEYAIKTNHGINNNFIKMSSVFNLENQKNLIELIVNAQKENAAEIEKKKNRLYKSAENRKLKKDIKDGKKLYEEKLKGSEDKFDTLDKFEKEFGHDNAKCLKAFFRTDEGKDSYKELVEKYPLYKYFIQDEMSINALFEAIKNLKIVKISDINGFYEKIVEKENSLYYMMAETSIKDAIKHRKSEEYFGFVKGDDVDGDILTKDVLEGNRFKHIFNNIIDVRHATKLRNTKEAYFLTFENGDGLFNILHNEFKTKIFEDSGEYNSDISTESKEDIMKLIYENLKIGNSISTQFAKYLVRLEAHMMLTKPKKSWFVVENNEKLKDCFDRDSIEISNKNAFVEIMEDDYEDIQKFLSRIHELAEKDFDISSDIEEKNK